MTDPSGLESSAAPAPRYAPVRRSDGVTDSERYLQRLCEGSFLRLWSYPGVYRNQGGGKEIADVLVVFGRHVIIFSDKSGAYSDTGKPELDWSRWFRKAVLASADQAWGAERWLREHPDRVYLDCKCTIPFPIALPGASEAVFHRIVVAHNAAERCRAALGGSGSLMLVPELHSSDEMLFAVGDLDPAKGFVLVLDDHSLEVVLGTLDTVSDFVKYLEDKEALIRSGRLLSAVGEEDLLAIYLQHGNARGHAFPSPPDITHFGVDEGHWSGYAASPQRRAQVRANEISYAWDELIGEFEQHFLAGTSEFRTNDNVREMEPVLRVMASEDRTMRRHLATQLLEVLEKPATSTGQPSVRLAVSKEMDETLYVFVASARQAGVPEDEYREQRRRWMHIYALVARYLHPTVSQVLSLGTEPLSTGSYRSEDALFMRSSDWTAELEEEAKTYHEAGVLREVVVHEHHVVEYPEPFGSSRDTQHSGPPTFNLGGSARNKPCPCGSGKKYKKCHGAPGR